MPLDFLKRKGTPTPAGRCRRGAVAHGTPMPEEVVAQEYQLKLYYAGKSSEGVRMKAGPQGDRRAADRCCTASRRAEIEVVDPLPIEFSQATPMIARPSEAMQWLNAHHVHSPITRHALVVLESIDAIDLAFDTFVCALLDGEVDTRGYPEYSAIVGGVAVALGRGDRRHDRRRRRRLGRQGRPRRHGPDRRASSSAGSSRTSSPTSTPSA